MKHFKVACLITIALALSAVLVLTSSWLYKAAIGYHPYRELVQAYAAPLRLQPTRIAYVDHRQTEEAIQVMEGVYFPASWTVKVIEVDHAFGIRTFECITVDGQSFVIQIQDELHGLRFEHFDMERQSFEAWGGWEELRRTYDTDESLLSAIFATQPRYTWELFPPLKDYREEMLFLKMRMLGGAPDQRKIIGRQYVIYIARFPPRQSQVTETSHIYFVDRSSGMLSHIVVLPTQRMPANAVVILCRLWDSNELPYIMR